MNKQRIQHNVATTLVNITYYGGTIGAGLAFDHLLNDHSPLAMTTLVVFVLTVEGVLRTLLGEFMDALTSQDTGGPQVPVDGNDVEWSRVRVNLRNTQTPPKGQASRVRINPASK